MARSKYDIDADLSNRGGTSHAIIAELIGSNKRVLDVGCDSGYLGDAIKEFGNRTSGFESNPEAAELARTRLERVEVGDLERSDLVELFGPGSFDVVVFGDVLEHLRDPLPVLRQSRLLLAPGGSVVVSTPNVAHGDVRLALLQGRFRYTKLGILDETHTRFFTKDSLVSFLQEAGFVLVELRRTFADLFATETEVREEDFPPEIVASLRADIEARTYQFVVRAVPDDAAFAQSDVALRLDEALNALEAERAKRHELEEFRTRLAALESQLAAAAEEKTALESELAAREQRLAEVQTAHDEAVRQRDEALRQRRPLSARIASKIAQ